MYLQRARSRRRAIEYVGIREQESRASYLEPYIVWQYCWKSYRQVVAVRESESQYGCAFAVSSAGEKE